MNIGAIIEGIELADVIVTAVCGHGVISEVLPYVKKVKANSSHQLYLNILKTILNALKGNREK